jgi:hypothetical protein
MRVLYRPITDGDYPVVDFGDSWGRINQNKGPLFCISKKEEPNWLIAFVLKWMQEPENLTEFGEYYLQFYRDRWWLEKSTERVIDKEIEEDIKNIDKKLNLLLEEKPVKLSKEENTAILNKLFADSRIAKKKDKSLKMALQNKILHPLLEFKDSPEEFIDFLGWTEALETREEKEYSDEIFKKFSDILINSSDKYRAYGVKNIDKKIEYLKKYSSIKDEKTTIDKNREYTQEEIGDLLLLGRMSFDASIEEEEYLNSLRKTAKKSNTEKENSLEEESEETTSSNDDTEYHKSLSEILVSLSDFAEEIYNRMFIELACFDKKWTKWTESLTIGTTVDAPEELRLHTEDVNIGILLELLDKFAEAKNTIQLDLSSRLQMYKNDEHMTVEQQAKFDKLIKMGWKDVAKAYMEACKRENYTEEYKMHQKSQV